MERKAEKSAELLWKFTELRKQAVSEGLPEHEISCIFLQDRNSNTGKEVSLKLSRTSVLKKFLLAVLLPLITAVTFCYFYPNWLSDLSAAITSPQCLVNNNIFLLETTRPVADCNTLCDTLTTVPKVSRLGEAEFSRKYAYTGRPVVVTDATKSWSAVGTFSLKFFQELYNNNSESFAVNEDECQFFPYETEFESLEQALNMDERRANWSETPWYFGWSNCDVHVGEELRKHYTVPYFLPAESETGETDWIFMGGPGPGANIHLDHVDRPSWQAQISGQKLWQLIPPPECENVCQEMNVTVNAGEIIVVDTNVWYHSTRVLPGQLSITIGAEFD